MSLTTLIRISIAVYVLAILGEFAGTRRFMWFLFELGALGFAIVLALLTTNAAIGRVAFGEGVSSAWVLGLIFIATMLGIMARYMFYLEPGQFSWLEFLKPLSITPIVVLPLVGSIRGAADLSEIQALSFAFLAFQNGFFWQAVLDRAKPRRERVPKHSLSKKPAVVRHDETPTT